MKATHLRAEIRSTATAGLEVVFCLLDVSLLPPGRLQAIIHRQFQPNEHIANGLILQEARQINCLIKGSIESRSRVARREGEVTHPPGFSEVV